MGSDSSSALDTLDPGYTSKQALAINASVVQAEERDKEIQNIVDTITELAQVRNHTTISRAVGVHAQEGRGFQPEHFRLSCLIEYPNGQCPPSALADPSFFM